MSSSVTPRKHRNDKQVQAIIFNMKEQRLLEKVYQALKLEEAHSLKLLRLSYIDVKANQCRIEKKVSKIHSYLTAADIAELKVLESEGKLPMDTCRMSNSALRIACAIQRLKLAPTESCSPRTRAHTARATRIDIPRTPNHEPNGQTAAAATPIRDNLSPYRGPVTRTGRAASVVPQSPGRNPVKFGNDERLSTAEISESRRPKALSDRQTQRAVTSLGYCNGLESGRGQRRPQTANCVLYSSHDVQKDSPADGRRKTAVLFNGLAEGIARQREDDHRQELLAEQRTISNNLEKRRQQFLTRTSKWVDQNRAITDPDPGTLVSIKQLKNRDLIRRACALGRKLNRNSLMSSDGVRLDSVDDMWKDLRKCRYIRASDDQLDSSGVNTLASDQFLLLQRMKISDMVRKPRPHSNRHAEKT
ncbi:hypothetical protein LSH36_5g05010 [Paralvinella palmiformis]|uniref:Uncharacterized protein n=1 Tax=Paralvinella palmiformis TaxID=53620 RepID=A0AAD9KEV0_9ANNE|nr:hypothetical protein LSH36_5g05010 [Paralvinella palmiformis]